VELARRDRCHHQQIAKLQSAWLESLRQRNLWYARYIGREKFGFNLDTTKNIMGMFTAFERCFDSLLPLDRISGYENEHASLPALRLTADARRSIAHWTSSPMWQWAQPLSIRQYDHLGHDLREAFDKTGFMSWNTLTKPGASIPFWLHRIYSNEII
jgi:hypothetical protein